MIKVSVILTTYNSENHLNEVITSINNQLGRGELFEIELIVVDDCSTDATIEILKENNIVYKNSEVSVATGGKQILYNAFQATVNKGDEIIISAGVVS